MTNKIIEFKSIPRLYRKEYLGLKPNTVRSFGEDRLEDKRYAVLQDFIHGLITNLYITITNSETDEKFKRKVKDVTKWKEFYIISWEER